MNFQIVLYQIFKLALRLLQQALLYRGHKKASERSVLSFKRVRIDIGARKVSVDENLIELTTIEFDLLKPLAENRGRVLTREQLLEKVWGGE